MDSPFSFSFHVTPPRSGSPIFPSGFYLISDQVLLEVMKTSLILIKHHDQLDRDQQDSACQQEVMGEALDERGDREKGNGDDDDEDCADVKKSHPNPKLTCSGAGSQESAAAIIKL
jgi:hypothetical protein